MKFLDYSNPDTEKLFLQAYDKYADAIFRFCYLRTLNRQLAEDITQETFIKTWSYLVSGKSIENIRAFLYKVAVNKIIDEKRKKTPVSVDEESISWRVDKTSESENIINKTETNLVLEKINLLEKKYRDLIILRYVDDFSPIEIAEIMDISSNSVSVRLNYAVKKFRELFSGYKKDKK
jgi:RNA polymerase sigma-70 factor (ECF subfamily)